MIAEAVAIEWVIGSRYYRVGPSSPDLSETLMNAGEVYFGMAMKSTSPNARAPRKFDSGSQQNGKLSHPFGMLAVREQSRFHR